MLGISLGLTARLNSSAFSPLSLFGLTDTGWFYDHSDFSALFQDAAGTIPVTAVGQPVGLQLDKSKGLTPGPNVLTSTWIFSTGANESPSGTINFPVSGASARQDAVVVSGRHYSVSFVATGSGTLNIHVGDPAVGSVDASITTSGTYTFRLLADAVSQSFQLRSAGSGGFVGAVSNISVRELPGNHRTQSISLNRPTLALHPLGGIRNLLTFTEQFDNAAWIVGPSGVATITKSTTNAAAAPDGTMTADRVIFNLNGGTTTGDIALLRQGATVPAGSATHSVYLRSFDGVSSYVMQIIGADGLGVNITVTPIWQRFSVTATSPGTAVNYGIRLRGGQSPANSDTADILIWGAQLELGSTATNYQRVGTAFDVTEAGVPDLYYLSYDGINDSMATASFAWGTDKATVVAGVRKLSDATSFGTVVEAGTNAAFSVGSFILRAPQIGATYAYFSRGSASLAGATSAASYAAPITNILTGLGDISGDLATLRVNGTQVAQDTADQGTGNYGTHTVFFGARAGTSLFFNGREYSSFAINRLLTAGELAQIEAYTAGKTGVVL